MRYLLFIFSKTDLEGWFQIYNSSDFSEFLPRTRLHLPHPFSSILHCAGLKITRVGTLVMPKLRPYCQ